MAQMTLQTRQDIEGCLKRGMGVMRIPANEVTLDPYVLEKRFKRHADRIILRKNRVTK